MSEYPLDDFVPHPELVKIGCQSSSKRVPSVPLQTRTLKCRSYHSSSEVIEVQRFAVPPAEDITNIRPAAACTVCFQSPCKRRDYRNFRFPFSGLRFIDDGVPD